MTTPELPPLPQLIVAKASGFVTMSYTARSVDALESAREARERILLARIAELEADAARYRYLRKAHWSDSPLCVVTIPKRNTILGADLPSGDRLDAAIDAAREAKP